MKTVGVIIGLVLLLVALACSSDETPGTSPPPPSGPYLARLGVVRDLGPQPNILAPSASGAAFFVGDLESPFLSIRESATGGLLRTLRVEGADRTLGIAASPEGLLVYIAAVSGSTVLVYNLHTGLPEREPLLVGQSTNLVATSADGRFVFGTSFDAGLLRVFDTQFNYDPVGSSVVFEGRPTGLVVTRRRTPERAYVVLLEGRLLEIEFSPTRVAVIDSWDLEPGAGFVALAPADERTAYVSSTEQNKVLEINLNGFVTRSFSVGNAPLGLDVSPDGRYVVVANSGSDSVSLISLARGIVVDELTVGLAPTDVLFTSYSRLYVTLQGEGGVAALELVR
jgi:YVTN family beta-propeller protein